MKSFTDNKGRTWTIEVTVASVKRETQINNY